MKRSINFEYDICFSFAEEDRVFVESVAELLRTAEVRIFYDRYEQVTLWGKDLYQHLDYIYRTAAKFCIIFISKAYAKKLWTKHELRSAQARAFRENKEYILPARFDDMELLGLPETVGYIDLRDVSPEELAKLIIAKLGISFSFEKCEIDKDINEQEEGSDGDIDDERLNLKKANLRRATLKHARLIRG